MPTLLKGMPTAAPFPPKYPHCGEIQSGRIEKVLHKISPLGQGRSQSNTRSAQPQTLPAEVPERPFSRPGGRLVTGNLNIIRPLRPPVEMGGPNRLFTQGLLLSRGGDVPIDRQMAQKPLNFEFPHVTRMLAAAVGLMAETEKATSREDLLSTTRCAIVSSPANSLTFGCHLDRISIIPC